MELSQLPFHLYPLDAGGRPGVFRGNRAALTYTSLEETLPHGLEAGEILGVRALPDLDFPFEPTFSPFGERKSRINSFVFRVFEHYAILRESTGGLRPCGGL